MVEKYITYENNNSMCLAIETTSRFTYGHFQPQIISLKQIKFSGFFFVPELPIIYIKIYVCVFI